MNIKNISKIINYFSFIIISSLIIYIIILIINSKNIKENHEFTTATIVDFKEDKGNVNLIYEYVVNGVLYEKYDVHTFYQTSFDVFRGKIIMVVYNKNKPQQSFLLLTQREYEIYNLNFPDSLKWLKDCK